MWLDVPLQGGKILSHNLRKLGFRRNHIVLSFFSMRVIEFMEYRGWEGTHKDHGIPILALHRTPQKAHQMFQCCSNAPRVLQGSQFSWTVTH